jgi:hypothetical protein
MGELGKVIRKFWDMENDMERGHKKEAVEPIMMDEENTREVLKREGVM